jgi:hypothetical protein
MKQLLNFAPQFNPTNKTLDFSALSNFDINKLYAVINVTRNQIIYAPGAPNLGLSSLSGSIITLSYDTSSYSSSDILNVYYDTATGYESNTPMEFGGQLQMMQETLSQILVELKVMNYLQSEAFSRTISIRTEELQQLRDDINNINNTISTSQ